MATLVGPDADRLAAAVQILRKRMSAGTAFLLVKLKAHRGEPANEEPTFWRIRLFKIRSEGRQRVVPMDESSSLHVKKTVPRGRESS